MRKNKTDFGRMPGIEGAIFKEKVKVFKFSDQNPFEDLNADNRSGVFIFLIFATILVFTARLFWLSVVNGAQNRELSENNRVRLVSVEALRGEILDRDGKILANSQREFFLNSGEDQQKISPEQVKELESQGLAGEDFEGELGIISQEVRRTYPYGFSAAHVLGYTSKVSEEDIEKDPNLDIQVSIGRAGIEETYQNFLVGKNGKKLIEVDSENKKVSILAREEPVKGQDIFLTIDAGLQRVVAESLAQVVQDAQSCCGAVVVQNPKTGEVLALYSHPTFDPTDIGSYTSGQDNPLFNRAVLGSYPPGSVFKLVSALAGLESGKVNKDTEVEDVGQFTLSGERFSNWYFNQYGQLDGSVKIDRAIARSNDIFFYRLAQVTGLDPIRKMALALGFGQKTGIDLPAEDFGLVPDSLWKEAQIGAPWYVGDTLHLSIGQGFVLTTPIQLSSLTSFMASGKITKPYLVSAIGGGEGSKKIEPKAKETEFVANENFNLVREGMRQACIEGGTGWPFFDAPYTVGCKTGTAEKTEGGPHAWFSAFAPYEDPQISIVVLVEEGGEGSSIAGPVAKEILDWYFENTRNISR